MMGDVGQPNFSEMTAKKSASRCPSHWRKALHASHVTRFACGLADEPMTPIKLPQVQARGSRTFMPTIGESDGADDGGDEDSKRLSCNICAASVDGTSLARRQVGLRLTKTPQEGSDSPYEACPRPFVLKPRGQGISSSNGGSSSAGNVGSDCCAGRTGCAMMLFTRLPRNGTFSPLRTIVRPTQPFVSSPKTSAKRS